MKNKKVLYLLTIIIAFFSISNNVNAAQELTCVYKKEPYHNKIILIQYSDGKKIIAKNSDDKSIEDTGWRISAANPKYFEDGIDKDNLTKCPKYADTSDYPKGRVTFYNKKPTDGNWVIAKLKEEVLEVKEPAFTSVAEPKNTTGWLTDLDTNRYTGSCMYQAELPNGKKHIIQLDFGKKHILFTEYDPFKFTLDNPDVNYSGVYNGEYTYYYNDGKDTKGVVASFYFQVEENLNSKKYIETYEGDCSPIIRVSRSDEGEAGIVPDGSTSDLQSIKTNIYLSKKGENYNLIDVRGNNPVTKDPLTLTPEIDMSFTEWAEINSCEDLLGAKIAGWLEIIWKIVKLGIPILLIAFGTVDFAQAVFAGKEDDMKKAQTKFLKRVVIAVVILIIPALLGVLLDIAHGIWGNKIGTDICGVLL